MPTLELSRSEPIHTMHISPLWLYSLRHTALKTRPGCCHPSKGIRTSVDHFEVSVGQIIDPTTESPTGRVTRSCNCRAMYLPRPTIPGDIILVASSTLDSSIRIDAGKPFVPVHWCRLRTRVIRTPLWQTVYRSVGVVDLESHSLNER